MIKINEQLSNQTILKIHYSKLLNFLNTQNQCI